MSWQKNLNGKLIGFSLSDEEGKFSIKINESADSLYIRLHNDWLQTILYKNKS